MTSRLPRAAAGTTTAQRVPHTVTVSLFGLMTVMGVVTSGYGPAQIAVRHQFGVSVATAGLLVSAHFAGEVAGVILGGLLRRRVALHIRAVAGTLLLAAGAAGVATAGNWPLLLGSAALTGIGVGVHAVIINVYAARSYGRRSLAMVSLLNAVYGLGAVIGPLLIAAAPGHRVTVAYGCAAVAAVILAGGVRRMADVDESAHAHGGRVSTGAVVALFVASFTVYGGVEAGVGAWESTHLVSLGWSAGAAALGTSLFWTAFTLGRFAGAPLGARLDPGRILMITYPAAAFLLLLALVSPLAMPAYMLSGFAVGPIFPTAFVWMSRSVADPDRAGTFALFGALAGSAVLPGATGAIAAATSLQFIPVCITVCLVGSGLLVLAAARGGSSQRPARDAAA